jgi:ABC-type branched-subunit amino acid transport system permease subunit
MPLAAIISALVALLIGYPALRLKGVYFFVITFSFNMIVGLIFNNFSDCFTIEGENKICNPSTPDALFPSVPEIPEGLGC